jgi:hypothetical protein
MTPWTQGRSKATGPVARLRPESEACEILLVDVVHLAWLSCRPSIPTIETATSVLALFPNAAFGRKQKAVHYNDNTFALEILVCAAHY